MKCNECKVWMVCIHDFCGYSSRHYGQISESADWCPSCKKIVYGGIACVLPNGKSISEPLEALVLSVIKAHDAEIMAAYNVWLEGEALDV